MEDYRKTNYCTQVQIFRDEKAIKSLIFNQDKIIIGRILSVDLIIDDISISRIHAAIDISDKGELSVSDLGSINGVVVDGKKVLRAKIDMESPNLNMRDPVIYRILRTNHHRTLDKWCIYPMYDFAHPISDYLEGISHSICTLEFEQHRPLYEWVLNELNFKNIPRQVEFARLNLNYTVMSKRKLLELVQKKIVIGWDDPRMPTIAGMRSRGFPPEAIRDFCDRIGVAKSNSTVDYTLLEFCLREDLNKKASRVMAVLQPLKVIENSPKETWRLWGRCYHLNVSPRPQSRRF